MERMLVACLFLMMPLVIALRTQQQVFLKPEIMCFLMLIINTVVLWSLAFVSLWVPTV